VGGCGVPIKDVILRSCEEARAMLGIDEETMRIIHSSSADVLARRDELVSRALESLIKIERCSEALRRAGLDEAKAARLLNYLLGVVVQGGYDERHCLNVARLSLILLRSGAPAVIPVSVMTALATQTITALFGNITQVTAMVRAFAWHSLVAALSYELVRQSVFDEALGIREEVYNRVVDVYIKKLYSEILKELQVAR
jgi:hypothetical protein